MMVHFYMEKVLKQNCYEQDYGEALLYIKSELFKNAWRCAVCKKKNLWGKNFPI